MTHSYTHDAIIIGVGQAGNPLARAFAAAERRVAVLERKYVGGTNLLGEVVLGESEAQRRLDGYLALLAREDVEYISIKISSLCSQLNPIAFDQTLQYGKAGKHQV